MVAAAGGLIKQTAATRIGLSVPFLKPPHRFGHLVRRAGKREAQKVIAPSGVEVDAWRSGDAGFGQHSPTKVVAIVGQMSDIGVNVKGTIGRRQPVEPSLRQMLQQ